MAPIAIKVAPNTPVVMVKGTDAILVGQALSTVVEQLVGKEDRALVLEEFDAPRYEDDRGDRHLSVVVDAAGTPPFLTEARVVVARHLGCFTTIDSVKPLLAYLEDPLPTTRLVLVWEPHPTPQVRSGAAPKKLAELIDTIGQVIDTDPGKNKGDWVRSQLDASPLKFHKTVAPHLAEWAGEDAARVTALLATIEGAFGPGTAVGIDDIEPFMGEAGGVAPWDLTDAIDKGDVRGALTTLHRMMHSGRHALVVMATLHGHLGKMLALDGAEVNDERGAALVLGLKGSTFPAKKALQQVQRIGSERIQEMIALLAQADLELKGARQYPGDVREELVMEILVARLASRSRR